MLEANQIAWGCTSRNGGQGQNASGRLYRSQWIERFGMATALRLDREIRAGYDTFAELVSGIECDAQGGGHLYIAHRAKKMAFLENEARVMRDIFGYDTHMLTRAEVQRDYCADQEAAGAMHEAEGISVHPLKLAYGYLRQARELGASVHPASPVIDWQSVGGKHRLKTPGGTVTARAVAIATGAYTAPGLYGGPDQPLLPGAVEFTRHSPADGS